MSRTLFLFALLLAPSIAWAQPSTPDTLKTAHGWIRDLGLQLAGSQAQYQNWQEGGIDALAVSARTDGVFYRVGGGIRTVEAARAWLDAGAEQIIIGTQARPDFLSELPRERCIAALDAREDEVVIEGWRTGTGETIEAKMAELNPYVAGYLVTFVFEHFGFRLNPEVAIAELDLLWRREMVTLSYRANWLNFHTGGGTKRAISFVSRPDRPNYAAPMSLDEEADIIASAAGIRIAYPPASAGG